MSGLGQGIYRLAVRHEAVDWTTYAIRIRYRWSVLSRFRQPEISRERGRPALRSIANERFNLFPANAQ